MQVYVQKSMRTTLPRSPAALRGGELSHWVALPSADSAPSTGNSPVGAVIPCSNDFVELLMASSSPAMVFHAAWSTDAPNTLPMIGFCVAAATFVSARGTSAAKRSWNCARSMYRNPAASGLRPVPSEVGYLSP